MSSQKPVLLVDGSSWLHRAFNALPPLTTGAGEATGAIFGVVNMLRRLVQDYQPDHIAVVFDAPGPTFRHRYFPDYKANRPSLGDELAAQIPPLHNFIHALGLPLLQIAGVEADDVLATLAQHAKQRGWPVLLVSSDKDLAQLVDERVQLLDTMKNSITDHAGVIAKFGVPPALIVDWLTLVGDSIDNIPGVPGVGKITAAKWLNQYGSLDALVANAAQIPGKIGDKLRGALQQLPLARQLATLDCHVPLEVGIEQLRPRAPDLAALRYLCERYEFHSWLRELSTTEAPLPTAPANAYTVILDAATWQVWLDKLRGAESFAIDTETTSLDYLAARLVGIAFATTAGAAAYLPLAHDYIGAPQQLDIDEVLRELRPILESERYFKIGQNLKYDWHIFANYGIELRGIQHDTMLQSYVLDSTAKHDLDSLAQQHLQLHTTRYEDVAGKGAKQITFNQVALEQAAPYAAEDADIALRLSQQLAPQLTAQPPLCALYEQLEMPMLKILANMERTGVLIDAAALREQSAALTLKLAELEEQAYALAGERFNLNSPKQLQTILFERLQLPAHKKTQTGQISTAENVLQELAVDYPLPRIILEYRALHKLKSTYTERLPAQIFPATGRVHTSYHQAITSTGRLSSSNPNLQNIPIRSAEGRQIRQAFIAAPQHVIMSADYSQIELRIMAHLSEDSGLLNAFAAGADIHRATAAEVFNLAPEAVDAEQRRSAKAINFGLIYGMSAFGLARQLGIERSVAQDYIERYFTRYPRVKDYMDAARNAALERGYVETVFGRRLYLPDIDSRNVQRRQAAERAAINAPMQGSAADIIKRAMLAVDAWLHMQKLPVQMLMQVHDELVFEVQADYINQAQSTIAELMVNAAQLRVALEVNIGIGANWDAAH